MYFAIAYEIWPSLTGHEAQSAARQRLQLWLWAIGMMVMTLPWHFLGLQGQWRRVASFDYSDPRIHGWGPWVDVSLAGGVILLASALLFVANIRPSRRLAQIEPGHGYAYALAAHPLARVPAAFNGFGLWNVLIAVLMLVAFGFPIMQFFMTPSPEAIVHRLAGG
jgi:cytochrome c oxidase subunit I